MQSEQSEPFFEFAHEALANQDEADVNFLRYLDIFSSISSESFYVIDIQKTGKSQFCYISPDAFFLCGFSVEEALELGSEFHRKIIHPDDWQLWIKMHRIFLRRLYEIDEKRDEIDYFSCTFRLQHNYSFLHNSLPQMVYQRMKPVWIDDRLRYLICSVENTVIKKEGHPRIHYNNKGRSIEEWNVKTQRWKPVKEKPLTERESAILTLAKQGKQSREIADILNLSCHTIRNQKNSLFVKLGVNSMMEATFLATNHSLIRASGKTEQPPVEKSRKRTRDLCTEALLQRIQHHLDEGKSIRQAAKLEGISEGAIRYRIKTKK